MRRSLLLACLLLPACPSDDTESGDAGASDTPTTSPSDDTSDDTAQPPPTSGDATTTSDPPGDDTATPGDDSGGDADLDAPAEAEALVAFLDAMEYADWAAEADYHDSSGPHGPGVRVFYSPKAAAALESGATVFPAGAATVKELTSEGLLYGWGVWVKVQDETDAGNGFYWYELIRGEDGDQVFGDALGSPDCVGCHSAGTDYLLSDGSFE